MKIKLFVVLICSVLLSKTVTAQELTNGNISLDCKVDVNLGKENTFSGVFVLNSEQFLFSHNSKIGQTQIWNLNKGGLPVYDKKWSTGWTNFNFYEYNGEVYFFFQKTDNGTTRIVKMDYDKIMTSNNLGERVYDEKWSSGWTSTKFFVNNNIVYFLHYNKESGLARLNAATKGGSIGSKIYEKTWSKGYTNFAMTTNDENFFILYQKGEEGTCIINKVNLPKLESAAKAGLLSPNLGKETYRKKWSSGWSNISFFKLEDKTYLFFNKNIGGTARTVELLPNGTLGKRVYDKKWSDGWSEIDIFLLNDKPQLFHQKASTGQTKICELKI